MMLEREPQLRQLPARQLLALTKLETEAGGRRRARPSAMCAAAPAARPSPPAVDEDDDRVLGGLDDGAEHSSCGLVSWAAVRCLEGGGSLASQKKN